MKVNDLFIDLVIVHYLQDCFEFEIRVLKASENRNLLFDQIFQVFCFQAFRNSYFKLETILKIVHYYKIK